MHRKIPRIAANIPMTLYIKDNEIKCKTRNLGMGGISVELAKGEYHRKISTGERVQLKGNLPKVGEMNLLGTVSKFNRSNSSFAVIFNKLNEGDQIKLWSYMLDKLKYLDECPYCGTKLGGVFELCPQCGWKLDFSSNNYFKYMKREGRIRQLVDHIHSIDDEELQTITESLMKNVQNTDMLEEGEIIEQFVGTCESIREVFSQIRKVAQTDLPVLILGETGTGKELTARAVHERSSRRDKPFVPINCAAIPGSLLETEFFGYEKGAYTGAYTSKIGKVEQADGGTLFLDEVAELPMNLQSKMLRFLDDQVVEKVGSREIRRVDVRLVTATNKNLEVALAKNEFRSDLYHRLKVFTITLAPLRDRNDDKLIMANYLLKKISREMNIPVIGYVDDALKAIDNYSWPGNVREMINKIRRAIVMHKGGVINKEDLELGNKETGKYKHLGEIRQKLEPGIIVDTLIKNNYNKTRSAKDLEISRPHLYNLMKKYNIVYNAEKNKKDK